MTADDETDGGPPAISKIAVDVSEKETFVSDEASSDRAVQNQLDMTCQDLQEAKAAADQMTLAETRAQLEILVKVHDNDPNFPVRILDKIKAFLADDDIVQHPENHEARIYQMKVETALITGNSPYAEVRAVVDNHDNPTMPSSTIRAWLIGMVFSCLLAAINQSFSIRQPSVAVSSNVIQVLAYPFGKLCERFFPDWGFTVWGIRHSLNPGPFTKKEHMLITIMANVAQNQPYTSLIIWTQYLPMYFNQAWASEFMYQILLALGTNFIGYGVAGLTRRFLVYPSYTVWPSSLVTMGVSSAFHTDDNAAVAGPFKRIYTMTRYKLFMVIFAASFFYFFLPGFLFRNLSQFSWMTWIAPDNVNLAAITGFNSGIGLNPLSTLDWNVVATLVNPLMLNFYVTLNFFAGASVAGIAIVSMWYTNAYWTAHIPMYSNHAYDNTGRGYTIANVIDATGLFDADKYKSYSPPFIGAGQLVTYFAYFAQYPAAIMYIILNHGHEMLAGFENLYKSVLPMYRNKPGKHQYRDIHNRLMAKYAEVPGWWYLTVLLLSIACGVVGISCWDKNTNPAVVFFGLGICCVFVIPIGIINAVTGIEVTLNVFAELLGGYWYEGDALSMNFLKSYGYVTCSHAIQFANDLKLAHYVKIPPRQTFAAQMGATLVSTFICTAILNFQMKGIPNVCTDKAPFALSCPNVNTFFMASILWGTIGPRKLFGTDGQYRFIQFGWAVGLLVPLLFWGAKRLFPSQKWLRMASPILMFYAPAIMVPYNFSYLIPAVPIGYVSWVWIRHRYLAFWSRYNYVTSAALTTGVALSSVIIFFVFVMNNKDPKWWGNSVSGCEQNATTCVRLPVADGTTFGPTNFH